MKTLQIVTLFLLSFTSINSQWVLQNSGTNQKFLTVFFLDQNYGWAGGDEGCIIKTTNGGLNWNYYPIGNRFTVHSVYFVDSLKGWAALYTFNPQRAGYIIATTDGGVNWFYQYYTADFTLHRVLFIDENFGWAAGSNGVFIRTLNGGASWQGYYISDQWIWAVCFINPNVGWYGDGNSGYIGKTMDGGFTWQYYYAQSNSSIFDIYFVNNSIGWAVGDYGTILKTQDGGLTWQLQSSGTSLQLRDIDFVDENIGWAVGLNGAILHTTNGGSDWYLQSSGVSDNLYGLNMFDNNIGWVAGDMGTVLFTDNGGGEITPVELVSFTAEYDDGSINLSWVTATEVNNLGFEIERKTETDNWSKVAFIKGNGTTTEIKNYFYTDNLQELNPSKLFYRLKQIDSDGYSHLSKVIEVDISLPVSFKLEQNYPNPFNPTTKIRYRVPVGSDKEKQLLIKLIIYDTLGNEVATLVNELKVPGYYEVDWDASNLASGVYLYQLQSESIVLTKKMMLMR
ncbi:MAG: YCF48-related protein [Ignavibacteriaceae bacterium]|jgi:photosystem II stability/assembly factor-like uncharacterized protein|nr:YCF48-related protein [Ignavibacteriaceae bacterium]